MKQMKKRLPLLLALLLCLSTAACAADPTPSTDGSAPAVPSFPISGGTIPSETTEPKPEILCQYLPEEVSAADGIPVLKWVCMTYGETKYAEEAAIEINRVLEEKELPFRLQFIIYSSADYPEWFKESVICEALAEADLICGDFNRAEAETYLMPITDYISADSKPSLQNAVPHEAYWNQGLRGDAVYGIPCNVIYPMCNGWSVTEDLFTSIGITEADFHGDFWEMDDLFARIYEANGNKPFLYCNREPGDTGFTKGNLLNDYTPSVFSFILQNRFQTVGSCYAIDYREATPKVVNYLETEYVRKSQDAMKRYADAGYTTAEFAEVLVSYGNVFCDETYCFEEEQRYYIPVEPMYFGSVGTAGRLTGVSKASQYTSEALQLLALMSDDEAFRELLLFGIEGRDYTRTESGGHSAITRDDGTMYQMRFLSPYSSLYSNAPELSLPTKEGSTRLETHRQMLDRCFLHCPVQFDFSAVAEETAAVNAILERKQQKEDTDPPVLFGRVGYLTETEYDTMLAEIKAAGGDKILAELQRQLDAWLAENPDW